jgi:cell shape-determining protein MreC
MASLSIKNTLQEKQIALFIQIQEKYEVAVEDNKKWKCQLIKIN